MSSHHTTDWRVARDVAEYGWHTIGIEEDEEGPPFAYSVGFVRTLGHPEVLVAGLEPHLGHDILSTIAAEVREGQQFEPEREYEEILDGFLCAFKRVDPQFYARFLGCGLRYYQREFPCLQCVWPDKLGRFPWNEGAPPWFRLRQPLLCCDLVHLSHCREFCHLDDPDWPFPPPRRARVRTTGAIASGGECARCVVHGVARDDWRFLPDPSARLRDAIEISLSELVTRDPSLTSLADLPPEWMAWREAPGSPWRRAPFDE
ncbi:MAG: DUF4262 domain-containing protein [Armatimonadota bacterium]